MWVLSWVSIAVGPGFARLLEELSIIERYSDFSKGIIKIQDATYYVLFSVFFLFLTLRVLESKKWRG